MSNKKNNPVITVIGGGNIGTHFACVFANKGFSVRLFTSDPSLFDGKLEVVGDSASLSFQANVDLVTNDVKAALEGCSIVFVTQPALCFNSVAKMIEPYIYPGISICAVPGTGGAEFAFIGCIKRGATLFGLQRVPGVARLIEKGKTVQVNGLRNKLYLSSLPYKNGHNLSSQIESAFSIPCQTLPNYLSVTLTPSNPILHTTRLCSMFSNYTSDVVYDHNFLFYHEWDDASSDLLLACDDELQHLCGLLTEFDLSSVRSLRMHYESNTSEELTKKICSIRSLSTLSSPMIKVKNGWAPDFSSRYFSSDFPFGLSIIEGLAKIADYDAKNIKSVMSWYRRVSNNDCCFDLCAYGIHNIRDLYKFYKI